MLEQLRLPPLPPQQQPGWSADSQREQAFELAHPRGQPSPGGVVAAQTQQAADDLQAIRPGQPVLVDVPAAPARLHRVLARVPAQRPPTPAAYLPRSLR
jgi:hypothetical protein